ncbi:hypothetical protein HYT02_02660 [Candidatus Gottesmanbacteria bacterium]|nr:hypothetical protein [Candidatus Gottesmanbacteria bacterium]
MNTIQRLAIGATTAAILLGSVVTPTFAATAYNQDISDNSFAKAWAIEHTSYKIKVKNEHTTVVNNTMSISDTGGNKQKNKGDGNTLNSGDSNAETWSNTEVNKTVIKF